MKLRPNRFKQASKQGPIDPIQRIQGKNRSPRRDPKCRVRETRSRAQLRDWKKKKKQDQVKATAWRQIERSSLWHLNKQFLNSLLFQFFPC